MSESVRAADWPCCERVEFLAEKKDEATEPVQLDVHLRAVAWLGRIEDELKWKAGTWCGAQGAQGGE